MAGDKKFIIGVVTACLVILIGGIFLMVKSPSKDTTDASAAPVTEEQKKLLEVAPDDYTKGNKEAPITLVEYLDFECEACGAYYPVVKQLAEEFKDDMRVVSRYFPLPGHKNGMQSALAVEAAAKQGKYWEMHSKLFEDQKNWGEKASADPKIFEGYAQAIGLNVEQFKEDVNSKAVKDRVERDLNSGFKLRVSGTPTFFLNGEKIPNPKSLEDLKTLISAAKLKVSGPTGEKVHEHADFKVYLNGKAFDFTPAKYQSSDDNPLDPDAHLHDGVGSVTHKHRKGITVGYFFKTIGMAFNNQCFVTENGTRYCNDDKNSLKFLVNGKPNDTYGNYEFTDLDKILISYGPKEEVVTSQINSITDDACLYSEKCPERGKPPTENCVGGLGTDC